MFAVKDRFPRFDVMLAPAMSPGSVRALLPTRALFASMLYRCSDPSLDPEWRLSVCLESLVCCGISLRYLCGAVSMLSILQSDGPGSWRLLKTVGATGRRSLWLRRALCTCTPNRMRLCMHQAQVCTAMYARRVTAAVRARMGCEAERPRYPLADAHVYVRLG